MSVKFGEEHVELPLRGIFVANNLKSGTKRLRKRAVVSLANVHASGKSGLVAIAEYEASTDHGMYNGLTKAKLHRKTGYSSMSDIVA